MGAMKKLLKTDPVIVIEWNVSSVDGAACGDTVALPANDLRALAQALGRLAAKRDLARVAANGAGQDLISAPISAKVKVSA